MSGFFGSRACMHCTEIQGIVPLALLGFEKQFPLVDFFPDELFGKNLAGWDYDNPANDLIAICTVTYSIYRTHIVVSNLADFADTSESTIATYDIPIPSHCVLAIPSN